jgi:hypothetical protein
MELDQISVAGEVDRITNPCPSPCRSYTALYVQTGTVSIPRDTPGADQLLPLAVWHWRRHLLADVAGSVAEGIADVRALCFPAAHPLGKPGPDLEHRRHALSCSFRREGLPDGRDSDDSDRARAARHAHCLGCLLGSDPLAEVEQAERCCAALLAERWSLVDKLALALMGRHSGQFSRPAILRVLGAGASGSPSWLDREIRRVNRVVSSTSLDDRAPPPASPACPARVSSGGS